MQCMEKGLKNLLSAARSAHRRDKLVAASGAGASGSADASGAFRLSTSTDDSAIGDVNDPDDLDDDAESCDRFAAADHSAGRKSQEIEMSGYSVGPENSRTPEGRGRDMGLGAILS